MIIDSHMHVSPAKDALGEKRDARVETFLAAFDASPLDRAVLLPIEPIMPFSFVREVAAQRPGKIHYYGTVNFSDGDRAVEVFARQVEEQGAVGLKLHPRRQGITRAHWPLVRQLAQQAANYERPVLVDAFPYGRGALHDESLELVEAIAEAVPKAKVIIAHMGGHRILDALILARTSYTIYLDLSLIHQVYRGSHIEQDIFYAIRRLGADRCLYGSDYPDCDMTAYYEDMRRALDAHGFTSAEQDRIFGGVAREVLQLD